MLACAHSASCSSILTFCWRHSLQARFTAVLRREDDGRVSSPFSFSSSLEAERLNPRVLVGDVGERAKGCWHIPCEGDIEIILKFRNRNGAPRCRLAKSGVCKAGDGDCWWDELCRREISSSSPAH